MFQKHALNEVFIGIGLSYNECNKTLLHSFVLSLGPLVNKVKEFQVETIVDTLCSNMLSDKEQLRDISSIGE